MKKLSAALLFFLAFTPVLFSQTFTFERLDPPIVYYPYPDSVIKIHAKVTNNTGSCYSFTVTIAESSSGKSTTYTIFMGSLF